MSEGPVHAVKIVSLYVCYIRFRASANFSVSAFSRLARHCLNGKFSRARQNDREFPPIVSRPFASASDNRVSVDKSVSAESLFFTFSLICTLK